MVIVFDPRQPRAATEACAPDPVLSEAVLKAIETTRRHWRLPAAAGEPEERRAADQAATC